MTTSARTYTTRWGTTDEDRFSKLRRSLAMTLLARALYRSPNGDRWFLVRETDSHDVVVRHQPNPSSGGVTSDVEIGDFLVRGGEGPEKQALLRLIADLANEPFP